MGIRGLTAKILDYYSKILKSKRHFANSDTYYLDYTSKIYLTTRWFTKNIKQNINKFEIKDYENVLNELVDLIANEIVKHIETHNFYKKYIVVFDYCQSQPKLPANFDLSNTSIQEIEKTLTARTYKKSRMVIDEKLIPYIDEIPIEELKNMIETVSTTSRSYWNVSIDKDPINYISLDVLLKEGKISQEKYDELYKHVLSEVRLIKQPKKKNSNYEDIIRKINTAPNPEKAFKEFLFDIRPQMIVTLIPSIIHKIKEKINPEIYIEFLGCNYEADFVIRNHIKKYHQDFSFIGENETSKDGNAILPTIFTTDTDLLVLLADINCVVNIKIRTDNKKESITIPINTKQFWSWVMNNPNYKYKDVIDYGCKMSTYKQQETSELFYKHNEELENEFLYIEPRKDLNIARIHAWNANVFSSIFVPEM